MHYVEYHQNSNELSDVWISSLRQPYMLINIFGQDVKDVYDSYYINNLKVNIYFLN